MRITGGVAADRWTLRHLRIVAAMAAFGAIGFALIALGATPTLIIGAILAYGLGWGWPGLFNLAIVRNNTVAPAAATGITQSGVYLGAVSGPLIFGSVVDDIGYPAAWLGAGAAALLGAVTVLAGRHLLLADRQRRSP
jgi:predicted MFS family arabinose efflux permease